jgi:beta-N-acetylhexosaminidase
MMPLGPVMADVAGIALTEQERAFLRHPLIGAVILFARNYESPAQLRALTGEIKALRTPALLIAVDHEGGRVQRFRAGFTAIPPMRAIGEIWDSDHDRALRLANAAGRVIGSELACHGVDFSFTPVLDLDFGKSSIIGDRSFSARPQAVAALAGALMDGLAEAGQAAVGKHFPGHGYVAADSHVAIPVDERGFDDINALDIEPYRLLIPRGLAGVMPAHVIFPALDPLPVGFSTVWLRTILRGQLGFHGMIFSDDLSMEGASVAGDVTARARMALAAGCDMVLVCNAPEEARRLVKDLGDGVPPVHPERAERMRARIGASGDPASDSGYQLALQTLASLA